MKTGGLIMILIGAVLFPLEFYDGMWWKAPLVGLVVWFTFFIVTCIGIALLAAEYTLNELDRMNKLNGTIRKDEKDLIKDQNE